MSIKNFHLVFILFAIVFDIGLAVFLTWFAHPDIKAQAGLIAPLSGLLGIGLIAYVPFYLRKSRKIIV